MPAVPPSSDHPRALGQHQAHQPALIGADRAPQRELAAARFGAREQQARHAGARDHQHERHRAEQQRDGRPDLCRTLRWRAATLRRRASRWCAGYACASCCATLVTSACACVERRRPARAARAPGIRGCRGAARACGGTDAIIDTHTSLASDRPLNAAGATPTIVKTWLLSRIDLPIDVGSRPNARSHKRSPITATSGASAGIVRRRQRAAEQRLDAEHREVFAGDDLAGDPLGRAAAVHDETVRRSTPTSDRTTGSSLSSRGNRESTCRGARRPAVRRCPTARRGDRIPDTATAAAPPHSATRTSSSWRRCRAPARAWRRASWSDSSTARATQTEGR